VESKLLNDQAGQRTFVIVQVELLSLAGDVGCRDTSVRGGHLIDAVVRPTLELIVEDVPAHLGSATRRAAWS
jgi:predicted DNA-binding protein with PD1-like motif